MHLNLKSREVFRHNEVIHMSLNVAESQLCINEQFRHASDEDRKINYLHFSDPPQVHLLNNH